jgi:hypothetical protein
MWKLALAGVLVWVVVLAIQLAIGSGSWRVATIALAVAGIVVFGSMTLMAYPREGQAGQK